MNAFNQDALTAALAFFTAQAYKVNATVYETIYPDWEIGRLIFVDTSGPEWSPGLLTYVSDMSGRANWFSGAAKDIPLADVSQDYMTKTHQLGAIGYQYNLEEINGLIQIGGTLPDRRARAARLAYQRFIFGLALFGDTEKGYYGITNNSAITPIPVAADGTGGVRYWIDSDGVATKTPAQIARDFNVGLQGIATSTFDRVLADTVMLPQNVLDYLAATPYSATTMETILAFIMRTNAYTLRTGRPINIIPLRELETAATSTTSPTSAGMGRMVVYNNSPEYLRFHLPMPHRFLPVYQDGPLNYTVPGIFRTGGVEMQSTAAIRYVDGISQ
jgi:hypothetical protein